MNDGYDGGDSYDSGEAISGETASESTFDSGEEFSAFDKDNIVETSSILETIQNVETGGVEHITFSEGEETTAFEEDSSEVDGYAENNTENVEKDEGNESSAYKDENEPHNHEINKTSADNKDVVENRDDVEKQETDYSRPTHWRAGMKDEVWESAKDEHGRVRDPVTGKYMSKDQAWDMGHKPGYEFYKHQESARERGISRQKFLNEYYNSDHYRPELPSSNRSHKGENVTDMYFGD